MPALNRATPVRGSDVPSPRDRTPDTTADLEELLPGDEAVARLRCATRAAGAVAADTRHVALGLENLDDALGAVAQDAVQVTNAGELATLLVTAASTRSNRSLQSAVAMHGVAAMVDTIAVRVRDLVETMALGPADRAAVADAAVLADLTRRASDTVAQRASEATAEAAALVAELDELELLLTHARAHQAAVAESLVARSAAATELRATSSRAASGAWESALVLGGAQDEQPPTR